MRNSHKLSIIIPVYNGAEYVRAAVENALRIEDAQVIVIDDHSTDGSGAAVADIPGVRVIRRKGPGGAGAARNKGIAAAKTPFITFLDADDRLVPEGIADLCRRLEETPDADFACGRLRWVSTDGSRPRIVPRKAGPDTPVRGKDVVMTVLGNERPMLMSPGAKVFRRDFIYSRKLLFDNEQLRNEDTLFTLQSVSRARCVCFSDKVAYEAVRRPDSLSRSNFPEMIAAMEHVWQKGSSDLLFCESTPDFADVNTAWLRSLLYQYRQAALYASPEEFAALCGAPMSQTSMPRLAKKYASRLPLPHRVALFLLQRHPSLFRLLMR